MKNKLIIINNMNINKEELRKWKEQIEKLTKEEMAMQADLLLEDIDLLLDVDEISVDFTPKLG